MTGAGRDPVDVSPATEAGRAVIDDLRGQFGTGLGIEGLIVRIEQEAAAIERRRVVERIREFRAELWRSTETKIGLPPAALLGMLDGILDEVTTP